MVGGLGESGERYYREDQARRGLDRNWVRDLGVIWKQFLCDGGAAVMTECVQE